jgi:hypothetical protein
MMVSKAQSGGRILLVAMALAVLELMAPAGAQAAAQEGSEVRINNEVARREILSFEAAINTVITTAFSSSPFALVQKPKGVYLPGYGLTFNFLINIHRAVVETPFGQMRSGNDVGPELKKRRIEELKEKIIHTLMDKGDTFRQLRKEEVVTIVAFFEDRNFPDEPSESKTIVLTAQKKDLDELSHKDDRWKEFKQRMRIVEY